MDERAKGRLIKELGESGLKNISLVETDSGNTLDATITIINFLLEKNIKPVLLSVSKPYDMLYDMSEEKGQKETLKKTIILDCVTKEPGRAGENVIFLKSKSNLTDISMSISNLINENQDKYIVFDSLPVMLLGRKPKVFARFIHSLLTKMRLKKTGGALISFENPKVTEIKTEITQLCDRVLKI